MGINTGRPSSLTPWKKGLDKFTFKITFSIWIHMECLDLFKIL